MTIREITDDIVYFGGAVFSFYVVRGERPALIELGISQTAPMVARSLRRDLCVDPAWLVAMHAHYDHAGGAVRLMREFPQAQLACSAEAARVLTLGEPAPGFVRAMQKVNENPMFRNVYPNADDVVEWGGVRAGRVLRHADVLDTGGCALEVIAAPGHSPCSLCLFHRDTGVLFVSDACGMPLPSGRIWPTAFDDMAQYLETMRRLVDLAPEIVCPGHFVFFRGDRARRFLDRSLRATEQFFERIHKLADQFGPDEPAINQALQRDYNEDIVFIQDNVLRFGNRCMVRQVVAAMAD
jgi:glyoxylase-like metal-dependent hydrolase (beta-lactamase superfamily II)